jgi:hypothetical protein
VGLLLAAAGSAHIPSAVASVEPLRRSAENIVQAPLDLAATPVILVYNTVKNFYASKKYTVAQKIYGTPPALLFASVINVTTSVGGAFARASAGIIELPIGIGALVADKNPAPLYGTTGMKALVDYPNDVFTVKFGLNQIAD